MNEAAMRLGLPAELVEESEGFAHSGSEVYADNALAVGAFQRMLTQWRVGTGGVIGLAYEALPVVFKRMRISGEEEDEVFDGIQVMEKAALAAIREKD